jgi:hypothetical protein
MKKNLKTCIMCDAELIPENEINTNTSSRKRETTPKNHFKQFKVNS